MAIIFEKLTVKSFYRTRYSDKNHPGSGYCEDQFLVQQLVRQRTHRLLGFIPLKTELILEEEIVPPHVWIGIGALGYDSSEWKSAFKEYIPNGKVTIDLTQKPQPALA